MISFKNKALLYALILGIFCATFITGCKAPPPEPKKPFVIGFNEWVGFAPFFLAKEKGYFGNLDVTLNFIDLEGDKRAGLYSGKFQMICETMDMFQTSRDTTDYPGKIIFAIDESLGGDGVVATKEIQTLADLKGKIIASEPGLPAHFVLQYLLHQEGMTLADVDVQDMNSSDAAAAFIAGRVDVAGTYEPYLSSALDKREGAHILVSTRDLPGLIVDVAIVTQETLQNRNDDAKTIYLGWCKALKDLEKSPVESIAIMAKAFKLTPKEFDDMRSGLRYISYEDNLKMFGTQDLPGSIVETFDLAGAILLSNHLTTTVAEGKNKIDFSVAPTPLK